ncbi:photosystem II reaction center W protein, chloroplastic-like [Olea europaea var. sylvestris]|uniref:PSII 6.1 kDa protein n=1 Tax=Olea europaea subsp. europaea TaxID=158383 RepID=A0A8S0U9E3_OLEEU|nr:photosystem II reaction center W protein, chloroplastic-like [Olea europaea var. sylvestris]CAA3014206.1 photosystem II reaction center W, chloroplastic-like [Olea europaea subsp. europaea]
MATISACTATSSLARTALVQKASVARHSSVLGLPSMAKVGKVRCSMEEKPQESDSKLGMGASLMAAATFAATISGPAMALVDERMSTEGTGLPFGLSNNLLGWILLGVFALIWSLYTIYTSSLEEDEESGLSL